MSAQRLTRMRAVASPGAAIDAVRAGRARAGLP